jgi:hypothetical protein
MKNHPLNMAVRFLLEMALVVIFAYWAWRQCEGICRIILSLLLPGAGIFLWAIFRVEGDPGKAVVAIPGWMRLAIEGTLFLLAFFMLLSLQFQKGAYIFIAVTVLHYMISFDRIRWLLKK